MSHGDFICHPRPCERYNHGTVVEFYCDPGYSLTSDYKYITCQYGEWFPSYQVSCIKSGERGRPGAAPHTVAASRVPAPHARLRAMVQGLIVVRPCHTVRRAELWSLGQKGRRPLSAPSLSLPLAGTSAHGCDPNPAVVSRVRTRVRTQRMASHGTPLINAYTSCKRGCSSVHNR